MMYTNQLKTLYELLISGKKLTSNILAIYGIKDSILEGMLNEGLIYQVSPQEYNITSVNKFFLYGKELLINRRKREANNCFELCHKMDPNNRPVCLQLFMFAVIREDYEDALKYLEHLEAINSTDYAVDHNIYFHFINLVNLLPKEYESRIQYISENPESLLYKDPTSEQKGLNTVMELAQKGKYKFALVKLNDLLAKDRNYTPERLIIKQFLGQAISLEDILKRKLLSSTYHESYEGIIIDLDKRRKHRPLKKDEEDIYEVAGHLLDMKRTGQIPEMLSTGAISVSEAIRFQDFETALMYEEDFVEYNQKNNPSKKNLHQEVTLYILLQQINTKIKLLKEAEQKQPNSDEDLPFIIGETPKKLVLQTRENK